MLSLLAAVVLFLIFSFTVLADEQRSGCCSSHGGVWVISKDTYKHC